jgi:RNA polymerase sigma-70 factor (ECF subfamily)
VGVAIEIPTSLLLTDSKCSPSQRGHLEEKHLLAAFTQGDHEAFTVLYKRHSRAIFHFAFYMAGDADKADELTQQVFVWLIHNPLAFDPARGTLPAFLAGVARKFLLRQQRFENRWSPLEDAILTLQSINLSYTPSLVAEAAIDTAQLRQAIALLPLRYREVVILCDLQEKEYAEAANILQCAVGTVRSRLHRGRNLLARKLTPKSKKK